jgi:tricorn protease-like protein
MRSARKEIDSIRSTVSESSDFDNVTIYTQIARHSKRISVMLEKDQKRLSQRWSQSFPDGPSETAGTVASEASRATVYLEQTTMYRPNSATSELKSRSDHDFSSTFDPRAKTLYMPFVGWLQRLEPAARQVMLCAFKQDTTMWPSMLHEIPGARNPRSPVTSLTGIFPSAASQHIIDLVEQQTQGLHG